MPNQINKTAQDHLEDAQVNLESLEGSLLRLFVSYGQCDLSEDKAKAMISVCEMLANGALEDIESASAKTKVDIQAYITQAYGIVIMLEEIKGFHLAKGYTEAVIHGLFTVAGTLNQSLETAVDAIMNAGGAV
ncbi:hypothetical protein [Acinetobacter sp. YH12096]|uniref:hypothetical protein n=1 Tax=Acinetobacter sp. YH12096 TaxID=2601085 RepID=UPI0015D35FB0|nr:hypothetical protein [Acinetobacter sp. YH12096]